jgi:hypothetical protein
MYDTSFFTSSGGCKYTAAPTKRKDGIKKDCQIIRITSLGKIIIC